MQSIKPMIMCPSFPVVGPLKLNRADIFPSFAPLARKLAKEVFDEA
jgi:hypothetical protein